MRSLWRVFQQAVKREKLRETIPFSKQFEALKCAVWLDPEKGRSGEFQATLSTNGSGSSRVKKILKPENTFSGLLHDL